VSYDDDDYKQGLLTLSLCPYLVWSDRAPFHCEFMAEAAQVMKDALKSVTFQKPCVDVISNVTAKPVSRPHSNSIA
jgi:hypothetical protein